MCREPGDQNHLILVCKCDFEFGVAAMAARSLGPIVRYIKYLTTCKAKERRRGSRKCRTLYVYNSHNKSIEFRGSSGRSAIYIQIGLRSSVGESGVGRMTPETWRHATPQ